MEKSNVLPHLGPGGICVCEGGEREGEVRKVHDVWMCLSPIAYTEMCMRTLPNQELMVWWFEGVPDSYGSVYECKSNQPSAFSNQVKVHVILNLLRN